jgi:hypothetical protein
MSQLGNPYFGIEFYAGCFRNIAIDGKANSKATPYK